MALFRSNARLEGQQLMWARGLEMVSHHRLGELLFNIALSKNQAFSWTYYKSKFKGFVFLLQGLSYLSWFSCVEIEILVDMVHNDLLEFSRHFKTRIYFHVDGFFHAIDCCGMDPGKTACHYLAMSVCVICLLFHSSFWWLILTTLYLICHSKSFGLTISLDKKICITGSLYL